MLTLVNEYMGISLTYWTSRDFGRHRFSGHQLHQLSLNLGIYYDYPIITAMPTPIIMTPATQFSQIMACGFRNHCLTHVAPSA